MKKPLLLLVSITLFGCKFQSKKTVAAVVSARLEASKIGVEIMNQGGNAFDAMVATDLALSVCYPNAGNIGGGGFLVYRTNAGEIGTLDFREKAPSLAHEKMFLNSNGEILQKSDAFIFLLTLLKKYVILKSIIQITPKVIRDFFYDVIAKNRYKWFGKYESCKIPKSEWKSRFL